MMQSCTREYPKIHGLLVGLLRRSPLLVFLGPGGILAAAQVRHLTQGSRGTIQDMQIRRKAMLETARNCLHCITVLRVTGDRLEEYPTACPTQTG